MIHNNADNKRFRLEEFVARDLHNFVYLEELVFPKTRFTPTGRSEVELADAVVALKETLIILQMKERSPADAGDHERERNWFSRKVMKQATKQIRDTLSHLESKHAIWVENSRGRKFNLAEDRYRETIKVVVYKSSENLPEDCRSVRFHISETVGLIHILQYEDYVRMSEFLRVPEEIRRYFSFREKVLTQHADQCRSLPEACLVGGFIDDSLPSKDSYQVLHRTIDDEETWNIVPLLRGLHDHQATSDYSDDYYRILLEFTGLPRSMWREVKKRISIAIDKVTADDFAIPYRVTDPVRDVGVVIVPMDSDYSQRSDWNELRETALINMTQLHKFDHKLSKCIGILVAKIGDMFDIQWCMIEYPWEDDVELRARLDADSPFRKTSEKQLFGFFTVDG
jgi:hypothetical protein